MEDSARTNSRFSFSTALSWLVAGLAFVVVLEVCVRIEDRLVWGGPILGAYSFNAMFGVDSIGWRPRPGGSYQQFSINSLGFRGPEASPAPSPDTTRVVVMGASESFGQSESAGNEYPRALERKLNERSSAPARSYEVLNAAIPGMSVARMEEYWNRRVRRFDPDIVVVYPSPGFYLSASPPADSAAQRVGGFATPDDEIRLRDRARTTLISFLPPVVMDRIKRWQIGRVRRGYPADWPWSTIPEARLDQYERHLTRLLGALEDQGVQTFVATHVSAIDPPLSRREERLLIGWQKFHPRADPRVILRFEAAANARLRAAAARTGATVIDLADSLGVEPEWFSDHQHFTDQGADTVASVLARSLTRSARR